MTENDLDLYPLPFQTIAKALHWYSSLPGNKKYLEKEPFNLQKKDFYIQILNEYASHLLVEQLASPPGKNYGLAMLRFNVDTALDFLNGPQPITNNEEHFYLDLIQNILENGEERIDRTGVGTFSLFGTRLEFDLSKGFPLLTTRKMAWKSILRELLWFISGSTDVTVLQKQNVHIWDGNTSKEFMEKNGLHLPAGSVGAGYGFQWRHFGAKYTDPQAGGVDQIKYVEDELKNNPYSRRILFWLGTLLISKTLSYHLVTF